MASCRKKSLTSTLPPPASASPASMPVHFCARAVETSKTRASELVGMKAFGGAIAGQQVGESAI
jgi:hypothetical protein